MATTDPTFLTACEATAALRAGRLSSVDLTRAYIERIQVVDPAVRAYLAVTADVALAQAERADGRRAAGADGPLLGLPYALNDAFATAGITTTGGSRLLADYVPPDSSTVYRRLDEAGAVLLGKLNLDERGPGSSAQVAAFFNTRNPWDLARAPGGSCDGAAAAVAADLATFAVGTDRGGWVRQPAARCGVVGLKPTYGRIPRSGLVACAAGLDQAEPLTKDVRDAAVVLGALAGHDPADDSSLDAPVPDYAAALGDGALAGLRLGLPRQVIDAGPGEGARATVAAIEVMVGLGAVPVEADLPPEPYAPAAGNHLGTAGRGVRAGLDAALTQCDVLVIPGATGPAGGLGARPDARSAAPRPDDDPIGRGRAGYPELTVPCGFADGLPVGLRLLGRPLDEATLLRIGHAYARATDWCRRRPRLTEVLP